jgi:hypothetical protein
MDKRSFIMGITLVLLLAGAIGAADSRPKTRHVQCKGSATFADGVETHIDTNGDNASAVLGQGLEDCTNGRFFFQEEVEWVARPVTSACPLGTAEELFIDATHGQQRSAATDEKTSDQLFGQITSATLCFNPSASPQFTVSGHFEIIGGTGKYAGATGTGTFHTVANYLMVGSKGGVFGGFGQYNFTTDGTLILPKGEDDSGNAE